ncbi:hypothetical protein GRAN_4050 [Granulicella sibirica]|uniref:Uncharacterized protein n=1 Tax=Granulicella sibirica TaxID=2479048 RepID=A0A4Q0T0M8_9BACT|nr:hypothetical protein GRAN_4050 [Granulicella sibirica]
MLSGPRHVQRAREHGKVTKMTVFDQIGTLAFCKSLFQ